MYPPDISPLPWLGSQSLYVADCICRIAGGNAFGGVVVRVDGVRKEGRVKCAYNFLKPQIVVADTKNH